MNGVAMPSASAGSSQREASVMCTPNVIVPSGAATAGRTAPRASARATAAVRRVMSLLAGPRTRRLRARRLGRAVLPGQSDIVRTEQAVVGQALDRREVAVRDVLGSLEATDVVRHGAEAQVH